MQKIDPYCVTYLSEVEMVVIVEGNIESKNIGAKRNTVSVKMVGKEWWQRICTVVKINMFNYHSTYSQCLPFVCNLTTAHCKVLLLKT